MPRTHDFPHGGTITERNRKARKPLRFPELPLLGSNQDSSDPESGAPTGDRVTQSLTTRREASVSDTSHTISHTVRHTPTSYSSRCRPLALGGGWGWGR